MVPLFYQCEFHFKEAVKRFPDNKTVKDVLAESLFRVNEKLASENRIRDQITILEEAVKANPHYGKCQFSLAKVYDNGKDGINAVIHMTLAREAFDKSKETWAEAWQEFKSNKYQQLETIGLTKTGRAFPVEVHYIILNLKARNMVSPIHATIRNEPWRKLILVSLISQLNTLLILFFGAIGPP